MAKEKIILKDGKDDTKWLSELYCGSWLDRTGMYIQTTFDPVSTHALYGVPSSKREEWKALLRRNKGITRVRMLYANCKAYTIICFKYNSQKDQIRYPQLKKD